MLNIAKYEKKYKHFEDVKDIIAFLNATLSDSFVINSKMGSVGFQHFILHEKMQLLSPVLHRYVEISQAQAIVLFNELISQRKGLYSEGWMEVLYDAREQCMKRFDSLISDLVDLLNNKLFISKSRRVRGYFNRAFRGGEAKIFDKLKYIIYEEYVDLNRRHLISVIDDFLRSRIAAAKVACILPKRYLPPLKVIVHTYLTRLFGRSILDQYCLLQGQYSKFSNRLQDINDDYLVQTIEMKNSVYWEQPNDLTFNSSEALNELSRSLISLKRPLSPRAGGIQRILPFPTVSFLKRVLWANAVDNKRYIGK